MRSEMRCQPRSRMALNNPCLLPKCFISCDSLVPASRTIATVLVFSYPPRANKCFAAIRMRSCDESCGGIEFRVAVRSEVNIIATVATRLFRESCEPMFHGYATFSIAYQDNDNATSVGRITEVELCPKAKLAPGPRVRAGNKNGELSTGAFTCTGRFVWRRIGASVFHGLVDDRIELTSIHHFHKGLAPHGIAYHVNGRSMVKAHPLAKLRVGFYLRRQLSHGVDHEGQGDLVIGRKALGHAPKVRLGNRRLVGKDKQAVIVAQLLRNCIEVARVYRCIERPGVHRQREVILHQRNVVLLGGLV